MALNSPPVFTTGPSRGQMPFGLFSVLAPTPGPERWEAGGVTWQALTCEPAQPLPFECAPDESSEQLRFEDSGPNFGEAKPFIVNGFFECGSVGFSPEDARALAEAHLISTEQTAAEKAFWNGDQQNYPNLANSGGDADDTPYDAPTNLGSFSPMNAVAELEQFIATMYGSLGVIHVPRDIATRLLAKRLLHTYQGRLFTKLDTPVVAGAGYDGDTIRATPAIFGYRSDVFSNTEQMSGFDVQRNDLRGHAARTYAIGFDPCGVAHVTVNFDEGAVE